LKLYAISDLHLDFKVNMEALRAMPRFARDWLITGGDLCTSEKHLREALDILCAKFAKVFWVPGNHELWSSKATSDGEMLQGVEKYLSLVEVCREYGVATPEDPFVSWPGPGEPCLIAPLFVLYDYSFRPADVALEDAVSWAMEGGVLCSDERLITPAPYSSMIDWCDARLEYSVRRLDAVPSHVRLVLVNHFPLREALVRIRRIPRFSIWCGTKRTEDWHRSYPVKAAISGHLHMRATDYVDGVRFEEVSLGYPRDWDQAKGVAYYLREILPGPPEPTPIDEGPIWRFF